MMMMMMMMMIIIIIIIIITIIIIIINISIKQGSFLLCSRICQSSLRCVPTNVLHKHSWRVQNVC